MNHKRWQPFRPAPRPLESTGPSGPVEPWASIVRHVVVVALASLIGGVLVGGVGGRLVMFVSRIYAQPEAIGRFTENGNRIGEFTIGGTIGLVIFVGLLGGVAASVVIVATEPWASRVGPFDGLVVGMATLAVIGTEVFESVDFRIIDPLGLNLAMFLALFLLFGYVVVVLSRLLERRLPEANGTWLAVFISVLALGAIPLMLLFLNFTSSEFCGCEPWHLMGGLTFLLIGAAVTVYLSLMTRGRNSWLSKVGFAVGAATLAAILVLGATRLAENISALV